MTFKEVENETCIPCFGCFFNEDDCSVHKDRANCKSRFDNKILVDSKEQVITISNSDNPLIEKRD